MPKILVADDSIAVRKVAERLLTEAGLGVTLAANGEEALALLAREVPDLIVSDVIMPDKSGYEVCAFVRGQAALANTPVLLISGIVNDEVTKQAESCHADGVLKKPFQGTSLKDRVLELLGKKQSAPAPAPAKAAAASAAPTAPANAQVPDEQGPAARQAIEKLKQIEEELQNERRQTSLLTQRISQLETQTGRIKELEAQSGRLKELEVQAARMKELEVQSGRMRELEAMLVAEREQTAQAKTAVTELTANLQRLKELEPLLKHEREQSAQFKKQVADLQSQAARVSELEGALQKSARWPPSRRSASLKCKNPSAGSKSSRPR